MGSRLCFQSSVVPIIRIDWFRTIFQRFDGRIAVTRCKPRAGRELSPREAQLGLIGGAHFQNRWRTIAEILSSTHDRQDVGATIPRLLLSKNLFSCRSVLQPMLLTVIAKALKAAGLLKSP